MSETLVYTLRLWRAQSQFRAALRAVGEEHTELFTEPAAVAEFLRQASAAPPDDGADRRHADPWPTPVTNPPPADETQR